MKIDSKNIFFTFTSQQLTLFSLFSLKVEKFKSNFHRCCSNDLLSYQPLASLLQVVFSFVPAMIDPLFEWAAATFCCSELGFLVLSGNHQSHVRVILIKKAFCQQLGSNTALIVVTFLLPLHIFFFFFLSSQNDWALCSNLELFFCWTIEKSQMWLHLFYSWATTMVFIKHLLVIWWGVQSLSWPVIILRVRRVTPHWIVKTWTCNDKNTFQKVTIFPEP